MNVPSPHPGPVARRLVGVFALLVGLGLPAELPAKTHLVKAATRKFDATAAGVQPGDTVLIEAGARGPLRIEQLNGTKQQPVTIRPAGALVIAGGKDHYAVAFVDCTHFHFTGLVAGVTDTPGTNTAKQLRLEGGQNTLTVTGFSSEVEVSHIEVTGSGFAGIMIKQDPTADPKTWRDAFVMRQVTVRDCVITNTKGEGIYLGNSFYATGHPAGEAGKRWPHAIEGVRVLRNRTHDTGCEGIQVGSATKDCEISGNVIEKFGQRPFGPWQDNGLQIGEGTGGLARDNTISDGPGNGIVVLGLGDNVITGNRITRVGRAGITCQSRPAALTGPGYRIEENVISEAGEHAILVNASEFAGTVIAHNRLGRTGKSPAILLTKGTRATLRGNRPE